MGARHIQITAGNNYMHSVGIEKKLRAMPKRTASTLTKCWQRSTTELNVVFRAEALPVCWVWPPYWLACAANAFWRLKVGNTCELLTAFPGSLALHCILMLALRCCCCRQVKLTCACSWVFLLASSFSLAFLFHLEVVLFYLYNPQFSRRHAHYEVTCSWHQHLCTFLIFVYICTYVCVHVIHVNVRSLLFGLTAGTRRHNVGCVCVCSTLFVYIFALHSHCK